MRDLPWAVGRVARKAVAGLPLPVLFELARLRGRAYARFGTLPGPLRANVLATFGAGPETDRLARRAYEFSVRSRLRHLMPGLRGFDDPSRWPVIGRERLDEALGQERGAILLAAHLAYASLIGPILRVHGIPLVQVASKRLHETTRARQTRYATTGSRFRRTVYARTRVTADTLEPGDLEASLDVRPIVRALARNRAVFLVGDGQRALEFAPHPVLGKPFHFPTGFARIAMATGAPVLPVFAFEGTRRHPVRVEIRAPLAIDPTASAADNVADFAQMLDAELRRAPHLWQKWANPRVWGIPRRHAVDPHG